MPNAAAAHREAKRMHEQAAKAHDDAAAKHDAEQHDDAKDHATTADNLAHQAREASVRAKAESQG